MAPTPVRFREKVKGERRDDKVVDELEYSHRT
jgi:hypothetical protein